MPRTSTFRVSKYCIARGKHHIWENELERRQRKRYQDASRGLFFPSLPKDVDFVREDARRGDFDQSILRVHAVVQQLPAPRTVLDGLLKHQRRTRRLNHDVESVRVILLERRPLRRRVLPVQIHVLVRAPQLLGQLHFRPRVRGQHQVGAAVELQQLRQAETRGAGADHQHRGADFGRDAVEAVHGARGGFEEGGVGPG